MRGLLPPDKPRELVKPGRVVVTLRKRKSQPVVHEAPRVAVRIEKKPTGKGILRVVSLNEMGKVVEVLAVYKPTEWKKAKVHRPTFKRRPEIKEAYKRRAAIAAAELMNDQFGSGWSPENVFKKPDKVH